ncbi:MAG TPA: GNAT family N-acetyltransferase [Solirubrobacteraceae bacterium]|nr:GNAT family N-acetyltransferase [Solirubrobacteraceae bacterium]
MIELSPMSLDDIRLIEAWLRAPHVARWWLSGTTADAELDQIRESVTDPAHQATRMLMVSERLAAEARAPVGWCQWYPYDAYPSEGAAAGARPGDCGFDYALGDPDAVGRGLGTQLIAALVVEVRRAHPGCGFIVAPDARNLASRRVLEHNGFVLAEVRPIETEPIDDPMAIYRLPAPAG